MNLEPITSIAAWLLTKGDSLWSGAIGSLVAGLVAAGVALYVVKRTTYNATCDSVKQIHAADRLARLARADAQEALERQLRKHRDEASLERQIAARTKLVDLLSEFSDASKRGAPIDYAQLDRKIAMAIASWRINLSSIDDREMRSELSAWGGLFHQIEAVLGVEDPNNEGPGVLNRVIGDLQRAALNYREPVPVDIWSPSATAAYLHEGRLIGEEYYEARKDSIDLLFDR